VAAAQAVVAAAAEGTTAVATEPVVDTSLPYSNQGREFAAASSRPDFFSAGHRLAAPFVFGLAIGRRERSKDRQHRVEVGQSGTEAVDEVA